jgi:hypothetical protein
VRLQALVVLPDPMTPPLPDFEERLAVLGDLAGTLARRDPGAAAPFEKSLETIRRIGLAAHSDGDAVGWERANAMLDDRIAGVERELGLGTVGELPPAPLLQQMLLEQIDEIEDAVAAAARSGGGDPGQLVKLARTTRTTLHSIDVAEPRSEQRLAALYQRYVRPLREQVESWGRSQGVIDIRLPRDLM